MSRDLGDKRPNPSTPVDTFRTVDDNKEPAQRQQDKANYRRRLHTLFDQFLSIVNNADPLIRADAFALVQALQGEIEPREPDLWALLHLQGLRMSVDHHQQIVDSIALVLHDAGHSWKSIGAALDISAQAAHRRYSKRQLQPADFDRLERYWFRMDSTMEQNGMEKPST